MPEIYTTSWYDSMKEILNHSDEVIKSAPRGVWNILAEIHGDGVSPYIGVDEVVLLQSGYYGRGWGGYWGWGWYGPVGLNVSQYDAGTITIDVVSSDPVLGLIWRGIARAELQASPQNSGKVESALREILADFPPGRGS